MSSPSPIANFSSLSLEDKNEDSLPVPNLSVTECSQDVSCSVGLSFSLPPNNLTTQDSGISCLEQSHISHITGVPGQEFVLITEDVQADSSTVVLLSPEPEPGKTRNEPSPHSLCLASSSSVPDSERIQDDFSQSEVGTCMGLAQQKDLPISVHSSSKMSDPESEKLAASGVTSDEPGMEVQQDNLDAPEPSPESTSVECSTGGDSAAVVQLQAGEASEDQQCEVSHEPEPWAEEESAEESVSTFQPPESSLSTLETVEGNLNTSNQCTDKIQSPPISCSQEQSAEVSTSTLWLPEPSSTQETGESNLNISNMPSGHMQGVVSSCPQELSAEESREETAEDNVSTSDKPTDLMQTPSRPHPQEMSAEVSDPCLQLPELSSSMQETVESNMRDSNMLPVQILSSEESASTLEQAASPFSTQETAYNNLNTSEHQTPDWTCSAPSTCSQEWSDPAGELVSTLQLPQEWSDPAGESVSALQLPQEWSDPAGESVSALQLPELSTSTEEVTESCLKVPEQPVGLRPVSELEAELELRVAEKSIVADNLIGEENGSDTPPTLARLVVENVSEQNSGSGAVVETTQAESHMDNAAQVDSRDSRHQPQLSVPSESIQPPTHVELPSTSSMEHTAMHYGVAYSEYHSASIHPSSAASATLHSQFGNMYPTPTYQQHGTGHYQLAPQLAATYLAPHPQYTANISTLPHYSQLPVNYPPQEVLVHSNYPPTQPQACVGGLPLRPVNLDSTGPAQDQNTLRIGMETGPCQEFSMGLYEKYKLWHQHRHRTCMYVSSSHDSDALACFFVPVLRSLCLVNSHIPLERAEAIAVTEWNRLSNFDRMEYYNMAQKFLEFEKWEQNFRAAKGVEAELHPMGWRVHNDIYGYSWKRRPQAGRGRRTMRPKSNPKPYCNALLEKAQMQELMEGALKEYTEVMEALESRSEVRESSEVTEEATEQEEKEENGSFTEYLNELCSQKEFVTQVGEVIDLEYVSSLLSSDTDSSDNLMESLIQKEKETSDTNHMSASVVPEQTGDIPSASCACTSSVQPGTSASQDGHPSVCLRSQPLHINIDSQVSLGATMSTQGTGAVDCFAPPHTFYDQTPNISTHNFLERGAPVVSPFKRTGLQVPQIYGMDNCIPQQQNYSSHHVFQTSVNRTCNSVSQSFYAVPENYSPQVPVANHENYSSKTYVLATNQNGSSLQEPKHVFLPAQDPHQPPASHQQINCLPTVQNGNYSKVQPIILPYGPIALTDAFSILEAATPSSSAFQSASEEAVSSATQKVIAMENHATQIEQGTDEKDAGGAEKQGYVYTVLLDSGSQRELSPPSLESLSKVNPGKAQVNYKSQSLNPVVGTSNLPTNTLAEPIQLESTEETVCNLNEEEKDVLPVTENKSASPMSVLTMNQVSKENKILETYQKVLECAHNDDSNDSISGQIGDVQDPEALEEKFEQCRTPPLAPCLSPNPLRSLFSQDNSSQISLQLQKEVTQMTEKLLSSPPSLSFFCLQALTSTGHQHLARNGESAETFISPPVALQHPPSPSGLSHQPCSTVTDLHGSVIVDSEPTLTCFVAVASSSSHGDRDSHLRGWVIDKNVKESSAQSERTSELSDDKKHLTRSEDIKTNDQVGFNDEIAHDVDADETIDYFSAEMSNRQLEQMELEHSVRTSGNVMVGDTVCSVSISKTTVSNLEMKRNETQDVQVAKDDSQSQKLIVLDQDTDLSTQSESGSSLLLTPRRSSRSRKPTEKKLQSYSQHLGKMTTSRQEAKKVEVNNEKVRGKCVRTYLGMKSAFIQDANDSSRTGAEKATPQQQAETEKKVNKDGDEGVSEATEKHVDGNKRVKELNNNRNRCEGKKRDIKYLREAQNCLTEKEMSITSPIATRSVLTHNGNKLMDRNQQTVDTERRVTKTLKGKMIGKPMDESTVDKAVIGRSNGQRFVRNKMMESQEINPEGEERDEPAVEDNTECSQMDTPPHICIKEGGSPDQPHEQEAEKETQAGRLQNKDALTPPPKALKYNDITEDQTDKPHDHIPSEKKKEENEQKGTEEMPEAPAMQEVIKETDTERQNETGRIRRLTRGAVLGKEIVPVEQSGEWKIESTQHSTTQMSQLVAAEDREREKRECTRHGKYETDLPTAASNDDVTKEQSPRRSADDIARDDQKDEKNQNITEDMKSTAVNQEPIITESKHSSQSGTHTMLRTRRLTRGSMAVKEIIDMKQVTRDKMVRSGQNTTQRSMTGGGHVGSPQHSQELKRRRETEQVRSQDEYDIDVLPKAVVHDTITGEQTLERPNNQTTKDGRLNKEKETEELSTGSTIQEIIIKETDKEKNSELHMVTRSRVTRGYMMGKDVLQMEQISQGRNENSIENTTQTSIGRGNAGSPQQIREETTRKENEEGQSQDKVDLLPPSKEMISDSTTVAETLESDQIKRENSEEHTREIQELPVVPQIEEVIRENDHLNNNDNQTVSSRRRRLTRGSVVEKQVIQTGGKLHDTDNSQEIRPHDQEDHIDPLPKAVVHDNTKQTLDRLRDHTAREDSNGPTEETEKGTALAVSQECIVTEVDHGRKTSTQTATGMSRRLTRSTVVKKVILDMGQPVEDKTECSHDNSAETPSSRDKAGSSQKPHEKNTRGETVEVESHHEDDIESPSKAVVHDSTTEEPMAETSSDKSARDERLQEEETEKDKSTVAPVTQEVLIRESENVRWSETHTVTARSRRLTRGAVMGKEIKMEVKTDSAKENTALTSLKGGSLQPSPDQNKHAEAEEVAAVPGTQEVIITQADEESQTITEVDNETDTVIRRSRRLTKGFVSGKERIEMEREKPSAPVERRTIKIDNAPCSSGKTSKASGKEVEGRINKNVGKSYNDERKAQQKMALSEKKQPENGEREKQSKDVEGEFFLKEAGETMHGKEQGDEETNTNPEAMTEEVEKEIYPSLKEKKIIKGEKLEAREMSLPANDETNAPTENADRPENTNVRTKAEGQRSRATREKRQETATDNTGDEEISHSNTNAGILVERAEMERSPSHQNKQKTDEEEEREEEERLSVKAKTKTNYPPELPETSTHPTAEITDKQSKKKGTRGEKDAQVTERGMNTRAVRTRSVTATRSSEAVGCMKTQKTEDRGTADRPDSKETETQIRTRSRRTARCPEEGEIERVEKTNDKRVERKETPQNDDISNNNNEQGAMDVKTNPERPRSTRSTRGNLQQTKMEEEQTKAKRSMKTRAEGKAKAQSSGETMKQETNETRRETRERTARLKVADGTENLLKVEEGIGLAEEDDRRSQRANQDERKRQSGRGVAERRQEPNGSPQRRLRERWSARINKRPKRN
ncbi:uncharacterized protein LOC121689384 isoform X2 [Alosa sapidissima]|uniref:uncharacterized protein LOC121689384 isoform X2 n=1 Tax=Alosa sapidissima TaxID=34773 RepID=UPI001C08FFB9|nr:uncharacterized protein LOC121689384 isoform X2 [Alosa sapidissima]